MQKDREKVRMYNTIYVLAIVLIGLICILADYFGNDAAETDFRTIEPKNVEATVMKITVYVTGEVQSPGLYEVEKGIRAAEAIEIAGGPTAGADMEGVNLAKMLSDGDQVKVPALKKSSSASKGSAKSSSKAEDKPVNINCGSFQEYMKLSGMTEEIAANIVKHIELYGDFQSIEELQFVEGMTPTLYNKLAAQFII